TGVPLPSRDRLRAAPSLGGEDNEPGQVGTVTADAVGYPRAHAWPAGDRRAGVHDGVGRVVVDLVGVHRLDDADLIRDGTDVRKQRRDFLAGPAEPLEFEQRPHAEELLSLKLGNWLALRERFGHRLSV